MFNAQMPELPAVQAEKNREDDHHTLPSGSDCSFTFTYLMLLEMFAS
jgi:hypothetical protein